MRRGTAPTHTFTLPLDANAIKTVQVAYAQAGRVVLTKQTPDIIMDGNSLSYKLTQQETLLFDASERVEIQVRLLTAGGDALASGIISIGVERILNDEVLE